MSRLTTELPCLPYEPCHLTTDDGVELVAQSTGRGPAVLIANGIGVTSRAIAFIAQHLRSRHRVITWDYRGAGRSKVGRRKVDMSMARHASDALQVLTALDEPRAAVVGWSMGVPVGLEMIRRSPERVVGMAALFGAPGVPFDLAFPRAVAAGVRVLTRFGRHMPLPAKSIVQLGATVPPLGWLVCSAIGFVGHDAHREGFHQAVASVAGNEAKIYFGTLDELARHDARDMLPSIRCPVLIVAGEADWVTPVSAAEQMAQRVPGSRLVVLPHTSHFGVIEHGPGLWEPLDEWLELSWKGTMRRGTLDDSPGASVEHPNGA